MKIGWANNVNQIIIDSTTIEIGNAVQVTETESGVDDTYLKASAVPDVFNVTMDFDFDEKDSNGLSEFDRFNRWYKFVHKYGTVPFEFPSITKFGRENSQAFSVYVISSPPQWTKSGLSFRGQMTWKEVFSEVIMIPEISTEIVSGYAENGKITIEYNQPPATYPLYSFTYAKNNNTFKPLEILWKTTDYNEASFGFKKFTENGVYHIRRDGSTAPIDNYTFTVN